ncbi:NTP transferase domain-containing protein [Nocardioides sp. Soil777]|uniref:NTP transferase domain-containing protein n=1 Tax=Nocardioides sp. Soil777 TaxID=1736409 RepID=UPI000AA277CE|nr:NTP transferase domain-containing protein [Nocardioides sp. Soil777]
MSRAGRHAASLIVLAKDAHTAKTRLGLPRNESRQLALRLAASTVRAGLASESVGAVFVVTSDPDISRDALLAGARVVAEPRPLGMVRAADLGRQRALGGRPDAPVAIIVADLPELRPADLDTVVREFLLTRSPLFVADHQGTGTTFLIHGPERCPGIGFGRNSAVMHERLGYRRAGASPLSLRRDLDTAEDLPAHPLTGAFAS